MSVKPTNLHRLREKLAAEFLALMDSGEVVTTADGEPLLVDGKPVMKRPSPAMLNVIRQFLRDNGIDRDPIEADPSRPALTTGLPFVEDDSNDYKGLPLPEDLETS